MKASSIQSMFFKSMNVKVETKEKYMTYLLDVSKFVNKGDLYVYGLRRFELEMLKYKLEGLRSFLSMGDSKKRNIISAINKLMEFLEGIKKVNVLEDVVSEVVLNCVDVKRNMVIEKNVVEKKDFVVYDVEQFVNSVNTDEYDLIPQAA